MNEINKEELLNAIDDYDVFTKLQREVLKKIIKASGDNNVSIITIVTLADSCKATRGVIYKCIKLFEEDKILKILPSVNKKINTFNINMERLLEIKATVNRIKKAIE